tara:strand:+ start:94 stop:318 length:225 start_codon:yes stop_codon:yes gene_type:complete
MQQGLLRMIPVTRLNKSEYFLNSDLILYVESLPDTVITLRSGDKLVVLESVSEVCDKIVAYQKIIRSGFNQVGE